MEPKQSSSFRIQLGLALNLIVFATVLNSVGIVVERSISEWKVSHTVGGTLEGCKDLTIALVSLLLASQVPRMGYRRVMIGGLATVAVACALLATFQQFWTVPLLFILCGASFALVKVSVYATVGLIAKSNTQHASMMNRMEGIYQIGAMVAPLVFSAMITYSTWTSTYWFITGLALLGLACWLVTPLDESELHAAGNKGGLKDVWGLLRRPLVLIFLACAWVYVMIEQSIGTWLPTFNRDVFGLSPALVSALLSLYFGSLALSRFLFGLFIRRFSAYSLQLVYLACAFCITAGVLLATRGASPKPVTDWSDVPGLVYLFCCVGFFIGPIYPTLNSMMLSRLEKPLHSAMTGLIIVFSALGGTAGSQVVGYLSEHYTTHTAFHLPLVPIVLLAILLIAFHRRESRESA